MKKHFLLFLTLVVICFTQASAQKRTFYQEGKLVDTFHSAVLINFSKLYDTVFAYDTHDDWNSLKRHCKIFAIKQHKYYKLDCLIGFYFNEKEYHDSIKIINTIICPDTAGRAFLSTLEKYHIYYLPLDHYKGACEVYDSSGALKYATSIVDGCCDRIQFFDNKTFKIVDYDSPKELYYKACHDPKMLPIVELIELFEKGW